MIDLYGPQAKRCSKCKRTLPVTSFAKRKERPKMPYAGECKECKSAYWKSLPPDHPYKLRNASNEAKARKNDRIRSKRYGYGLMKRYGITPEQVDNILAQQHGLCASCGTADFQGKRPHVDHCHKTKIVRGILCTRCNQGLGFFLDDPARLIKGAEYLERVRARHEEMRPDEPLNQCDPFELPKEQP